MMKGEYENVATDEKPLVYDHTQAIITPDEKRTAAVPDLLEYLGMANLEWLKGLMENELQQRGIANFKPPNDPNDYGYQRRLIVKVCLTLSGFFQIIVAFLRILLGENGVILGGYLSLIVHIAGFLKL